VNIAEGLGVLAMSGRRCCCCHFRRKAWTGWEGEEEFCNMFSGRGGVKELGISRD